MKTNATVLALLALTTFNSEAANLVSNGSFDNIASTWVDNTGRAGNDLQSAGGTAIPGWSPIPGFSNQIWIDTPNGYGLAASPGNGSAYFVDLTGEANDKPYGGIEQTIATIAGASYELTFDLGASTLYNTSGLGAAALTASATGASALALQLFTLAPTASNQWASESLSFTADSSSTVIEFLGSTTYTSRYTGLDNVAVTEQVIAAVPEPSNAALLIAGFGAVGWGLRKRRPKMG